MLQPVSRVVDLLDPPEPHRQHDRRRGAAPRARRRSRGRPRDRRLVRARGRRRASPSGWRARWIGRCATSWPSATRARRCSSPTASTRCTSARQTTASRPVPPELHAHGAGALRRRDLALVGCPDPIPIYTRFFTPQRDALPADLDEIGRRYVGALARRDREVAAARRCAVDRPEPIGVAFSGGIDSGSVFLVTYHAMLRLGLSPARLKAFVLNLGDGPDVEQARAFLSAVGLSLFLEEIDASPDDLDVERDAARARGLQAARRRVRGDGPAAVPRHPRRAIRTGATSPTATAATRTSRTIRSRRTPSSRSAASSTT